ncbi:MAG TPA: hypothetical protein VFV02_17665 [Acidimicrobiales bacterium]|nr:hypothetical protein [Acidimicrobiales bacterium]
MNGGALFFAVFLASAVEAVEATTIVLAAGTSRSWRAALQGTGAGLGLLAVLIAGLGPAVSAIPLRSLRAFVGGLLLILGLQWLRKAVLRASGHKSLRDEEEAYEREVTEARKATLERRGVVPDWYAFVLSFKGVVLEGLEVVFIVLTFGANQHDIPLAALAAVSAVVIVAGVGFAIKAPLARVPENTLKFVVGVMLTSFGMFWGAEGAGATWPGNDASLLVIIPGVALFCLTLAGVLRRSAPATGDGGDTGMPATSGSFDGSAAASAPTAGAR